MVEEEHTRKDSLEVSDCLFQLGFFLGFVPFRASLKELLINILKLFVGFDLQFSESVMG